MVNFLHTLSHAEEVHSTAAQANLHTLQEWYFAIPLFVLTVAAIGYMTWLVSGKKPDAVLIVMSIVLLIAGFTMFSISPLISVVAITGGIITSGLLTFGGLATD